MGCYEFAHRSERLRELDTLFDMHEMHDDPRSGTGSRERRGQGEREKKRENWLQRRAGFGEYCRLRLSVQSHVVSILATTVQPCFSKDYS